MRVFEYFGLFHEYVMRVRKEVTQRCKNTNKNFLDTKK